MNFKNVAQHHKVDVLILCALKDEYDQVLEVTNGIAEPGWNETHSSNGRIVSDAIFYTQDRKKIKVRATFASYMGREQTQAVASILISESEPKAIAMSGICAGDRSKVSLGDVIFADRLWSYDSGKSVVKDGVESFKADPLQYTPPEILVQHMHSIKPEADATWLADRPNKPLEAQENWVLKKLFSNESPTEADDFESECPDWTTVINRLWEREWVKRPMELTQSGRSHIEELNILYPKKLPAPAGFDVHVAPVATGAVVKEDSSIFSQLNKTTSRKVLGLDMEGSGLAASADAYQIPILFAKGVSDFADTFKDDRYRFFAARASAELLLDLIRKSFHLFSNSSEPKTPPVSGLNVQTKIGLIETLAELYPDADSTAGVWERAGGALSEINQINNPIDKWQNLWKKAQQGHKVKPSDLLQAVSKDFPNNPIILQNLNNL